MSWLFDVPQPTVTRVPVPVDHAVNAGSASWTFAVPQPTVTRTPAGSVAHAVDAGNVSWTFDVPEPTITHTSPLPVDHAVNAGSVSWAFAVPEPTITHTSLALVDHAVNAGAVTWTFAIPRPRITHTAAPPPFDPLPDPLPVTDRIIAIDARIALLISQWEGSAPMLALLRGMYGLIDTELVQALKDLERMRNWDTAEGVWLDYIGRRLGMERPGIDAMVTRFGFDGSDGVGFNQAPFATVSGFVPQVAVGDAIYLLCLKVWAGTILTSGTIPDMNTAVQRSFPAAYYTDGGDSTLALATLASGTPQTTARNILTLLDAWPRPAGVGLTVT